MKLRDILKEIDVTEMTASPEMEIRDIRYDSRAVEPGDLFAAVEGLQADGHRFIAAAVERGASVVLCQRRPTENVPYILTPDSRKALALASAAYFGQPSRKLKMIGVTGTNGKTTSTLLIKHILERCLGARVGLVGTISNWVGDQELPTERTTPESYDLQRLFRRMVDAGCEYAVMEVSSHALALDRVADVWFEAGLFTNLTQDHLDFHGTMENYAEAKATLFSQCARGAVNGDDPWAGFMLERAKCPMVTFSAGERRGDLWAENMTLRADGVSFTARTAEESAPVSLKIPGRFSVSNALTALAAGWLLGLELGPCAKALSDMPGVKGRVEVVPTPEDYTIIIDYAHTPDALENVLRTVKESATGRVVAVFGCGGDRDATKRPVMGRIAAELADFSVVTSDNPRTEDPEAIIRDILAGMPPEAPKQVICDRPEAIAWAMDHHLSGDVIVLAGKGHETYQEVMGVKRHMDEREIVAEHLRMSKGNDV